MGGPPPADLDPAEQELVVHLFAPVSRPLAHEAYWRLSMLWERCLTGLELTEAIPETGLPRDLPPGLPDLPGGRWIAAARRGGGDRQAILRREHDTLNLSLALGGPPGSTSGWRALDRLWDDVAGDRVGRLLGQARLYLGKVAPGTPGRVDASAALAAALGPLLPPSPREPRWEDRGCTVADGFAVWETSPRDDDRAERRIVVLAPPDRDPELSAWAWSRGDPAMPPLAIYLMHAARVRYQLRVWAWGQEVGRLRQEVEAAATDLRRLLDGSSLTAGWRRVTRLEVAETEAVLAQTALEDMRRTVQIAASNMASALGRNAPAAPGLDPFNDDRALAAWFERQLEDHAGFLATVRERAERIGAIARGALGRGPGSPASGGARGRARGSGTPVRMGFALDVVGYARRSGPAREAVQGRLSALVHDAVRRSGVDAERTDFEGTGDGLFVFLPPDTECHRAVPALIRNLTERLARDNDLSSDRIRLRMSAAIGPVGRGALGFSGRTVIELSRLIESRAIRRAVEDSPRANLVVLLSDQLYTYFEDGGHAGLDRAEFRRVRIAVKGFQASSWLWASPEVGDS